MIHKGQSGTSVLSHNTQELGLLIKSDRKNIQADKKKNFSSTVMKLLKLLPEKIRTGAEQDSGGTPCSHGPETPRLPETHGEMILRSVLNLKFHREEQLGL